MKNAERNVAAYTIGPNGINVPEIGATNFAQKTPSSPPSAHNYAPQWPQMGKARADQSLPPVSAAACAIGLPCVQNSGRPSTPPPELKHFQLVREALSQVLHDLPKVRSYSASIGCLRPHACRVRTKVSTRITAISRSRSEILRAFLFSKLIRLPILMRRHGGSVHAVHIMVSDNRTEACANSAEPPRRLWNGNTVCAPRKARIFAGQVSQHARHKQPQGVPRCPCSGRCQNAPFPRSMSKVSFPTTPPGMPK